MSINDESAALLGGPAEARRERLGGGGLLGGTVNMCKSLFGAGVLAMPHAFTKTGWALGSVLYLLLGLVVVGSNILLLRIERLVNYRTVSIGRLSSVVSKDAQALSPQRLSCLLRFETKTGKTTGIYFNNHPRPLSPLDRTPQLG